MALLNHTLRSLAQGVSQQHEEARFETQVAEMINCIPDISRGIYRRNPIEDLGSINSTTFNSNTNFFTYAYDRGDGDKYLIMLNGKGSISVTDLNTGSTVFEATNSYFTVPPTGRFHNIYDSFILSTAGDITFIVNKNTTVAKETATDGTLGQQNEIGVYWIKDVTSVETGIQTEGLSGGGTVQAASYQGHTYTLNGQTVTARRTYVWNSTTETFEIDVDVLEAEDIAAELASKLGSNYASDGAFVYWVGSGTPPEWSWADNMSNSVSFGWNGFIAAVTDLPTYLPASLITYYETTRALGSIDVEVTGGTDDNIGYWVTYTNTGWIEGNKPGLSNTLDKTTMPHVLVLDENGDFNLSTYDTTDLQTIPGLSNTALGWKKRIYGDEYTAKDPSFVGKQINDIFIYQNRLGMLAGETTVLSEIDNYGNFYPTTVLTLVDNDPIDLSMTGNNVTILRYAQEVGGRLVVYSDDSQFAITSLSGALTPSSTVVGSISKYNILPGSKPIVLGDSAYFVSSVGKSKRLYRYNLSNTVDNKYVAEDVTVHTPTYLLNNIFKILGHTTIGYTILLSYNKQTMYIFNGTMIGEKAVQSAVHRWDMPFPVVGGSIVDNTLYVTMYNTDTDEVYLGTISLNTPTNYESVEYKDTLGGVDYAFNSLVELSEWQVKQEDFGTSRGRLQIRTIQYSLDDSSSYMTVLENKDLTVTVFQSLIQEGVWDDTLNWVDGSPWIDEGYKFNRYYYNNERITVMGNSKTTTITFKENENEPTKGFNLKTVNYEGDFYQRSQRY